MSRKSYIPIAVAILVIAAFLLFGRGILNPPGEDVLAPSGNPADSSAPVGSLDAPLQSAPISESDVPAEAVKLEITSAGFSPSEFSARRGSSVTISLTSKDSFTHIFRFEDPSLAGVAVGIGPGETRMIPFNAPSKSGEYLFYCDVRGHADRGETGKMIVK
jgi:plastocyanin